MELATRTWHARAFAAPTDVQRRGWPVIESGAHALLVAPTGSGKTLAAMLVGIDRATRLPTDAPAGVRVLYVSPLKALVHDVERNLAAPLAGILAAADELGVACRSVRAEMRTGDTPQRERARQRRDPADILVTTPESLFLLLGAQARRTLATVDTVIVDEVHALAGTKRGAHLALSLERLDELVSAASAGERAPQRIGLSATVRPTDEVARFLGGDRKVEIVDAAAPPALALEVVVPVPDMTDVRAGDARGRAGGEGRGLETQGGRGAAPDVAVAPVHMAVDGPPGKQVGVWPAVYPRLVELIRAHRSTIVFVNSRGLCERLTQRLNEIDGGIDADGPGELVLAHHGSVSRERRESIEARLKRGELKGIVATSSLELGIDMGAVDLVVLVESPGSVARGLQRVGRAGHQVGAISRGVIFPKFRGDLLECAALSRRMLAGEIEALQVPRNPLDVLAQQVVALVADAGEAGRAAADVLALARRAYPFAELTRAALESVLDMLSGRYPSDEFADLRPRLAYDRARGVLTARRGAALLARMNAGTIPDRGLFQVHVGHDGPRIGELDEEMVYESRSGDVILLGASSWRIVDITRDRVVVDPAPGEPGRLPFWKGAGPGRPIELGRAIGALARELDADADSDEEAVAERVRETTPLDEFAARNLAAYLAAQRASGSAVPTDRRIVVERFRDELGDWRVCVMTPFGRRVHAPWALALRGMLARKSGHEMPIAVTDDGIVLTMADGDQIPPAAALFPDADAVRDLVTGELAGSTLFGAAFRENAGRALLLPRRDMRSRTPLYLRRLKAKSLLAAVAPHPDFALVLETYRECLQDVFDLPALEELLRAVHAGDVEVREAVTRDASPFARSLVFSFVATYLYELDEPLAERRSRALSLDRELLRELCGEAELRELLDPDAIKDVERGLQHLDPDRRARDADEVHDLLRKLGPLSAAEVAARAVPSVPSVDGADVAEMLTALEASERAARVEVAGEQRWVDAGDVATVRDALVAAPGAGGAEPGSLERLLVRHARAHGPFTTAQAARRFGLPAGAVRPVLDALARDGRLAHGPMLPARPGAADGSEPEWCDPDVLRRIKRATLERLRGEIAPVDGAALGRFLPRWHRATRAHGGAPETTAGTAAETALEVALTQLEGLALPWSDLVGGILPARVPGFHAAMLDELCARGELVWVGRGALGAKDGRVALLRRERAGVLLSGLIDAEEGDGESGVRAAILAELRGRGASFTVALERAARTARGTLDAADFEAALWSLVWEGFVTNDTTVPLASLGAPRRSSSSSTRRRPSRRGVAMAGGRWSLVDDLREPCSPEEAAHAWAETLLERYGVVSREALQAEDLKGGFALVYPALRAMEEAGRIRRGAFALGLEGAQFAHAAAVERLRAARGDEGESGVQTLLTTDPASPWGALLPWPASTHDDAPRPRRAAGAAVVLDGGLPVLWLGANRRSALTFAHPRGDDALAAALRALRTPSDLPGRARSVVLERVDGTAPDEHIAALLVDAGFVRDYRGWLAT